MLEPCDAKVSCTVLRGLGDRKVARLLGSFTDHFDGLATIRPSGSFPDGVPSDQIAGARSMSAMAEITGQSF